LLRSGRNCIDQKNWDQRLMRSDEVRRQDRERQRRLRPRRKLVARGFARFEMWLPLSPMLKKSLDALARAFARYADRIEHEKELVRV
jgi:hypothetical protein